MDEQAYKKRVAELERENRILKQKLSRSEANRVMLEEMLETHNNTLKVRNSELEASRELIRESEAKYKELAHRDVLTGLSNRAFFMESLVQSIMRAKSLKNGVALLFMDLDRFKPINDNYGHELGDMLLSQVAVRLLSCIRNKGIVARIGGDEFAILIENYQENSNVSRISEMIIRKLSRPFSISSKSCQIGVSIGISLFPYDDEDPDRLIQKADQDMYSVKKSCCNNYRFYKDII